MMALQKSTSEPRAGHIMLKCKARANQINHNSPKFGPQLIFILLWDESGTDLGQFLLIW